MNTHRIQDAKLRRAAGKARAYIRIRDAEIGYTRSGRGAPAVVLSSDSALRELLSAELSRGFSVIAPELHAACNDSTGARWLPELIEGLGLQRPHLVATDSFGPAALHFALGDADCIDRLAVVWRDFRVDRSDETADTHEDRLCRSGHRLLLLRLATDRPRTAASAHDSLADSDGPVRRRGDNTAVSAVFQFLST